MAEATGAREIMGISPVIPVVTVEDPKTAVPMAQALVEGGISIIEVTLRTPSALETLRRIVEEVPQMTAGAGTILGPPPSRSGDGCGWDGLPEGYRCTGAGRGVLPHRRDQRSQRSRLPGTEQCGLCGRKLAHPQGRSGGRGLRRDHPPRSRGSCAGLIRATPIRAGSSSAGLANLQLHPSHCLRLVQSSCGIPGKWFYDL